MKEPVDHIERPGLPWRGDSPMTECGLNKKSVKMLSRDEFKQRLKDYGQQRTALTTCMTCINTAHRWRTWEEDPREAVDREIQWEGRWTNGQHGRRLRDELRAVAILIANHREEFDRLTNPDTVFIENDFVDGKKT